MKTIMNIDKLSKISELEAFLSGSQAVAFSVANGKDESYAWIQRTLIKFDYMRLGNSPKKNNK